MSGSGIRVAESNRDELRSGATGSEQVNAEELLAELVRTRRILGARAGRFAAAGSARVKTRPDGHGAEAPTRNDVAAQVSRRAAGQAE